MRPANAETDAMGGVRSLVANININEGVTAYFSHIKRREDTRNVCQYTNFVRCTQHYVS